MRRRRNGVTPLVYNGVVTGARYIVTACGKFSRLYGNEGFTAKNRKKKKTTTDALSLARRASLQRFGPPLVPGCCRSVFSVSATSFEPSLGAASLPEAVRRKKRAQNRWFWRKMEFFYWGGGRKEVFGPRWLKARSDSFVFFYFKLNFFFQAFFSVIGMISGERRKKSWILAERRTWWIILLCIGSSSSAISVSWPWWSRLRFE